MEKCAAIESLLSLAERVHLSPAATEVRDRTDRELDAQSIDKNNQRRENCRLNQARYRAKKYKHLAGLEDEVRKLKNEVRALELQHRYLLSNSRTRTAWTFATEYFQRLDHGSQRLADQEFLRAGMTSEGVEMVLRYWRFFSLCFDNVEVELQHLAIANDSVIAATTTGLTITEDSLRRVFPHLNSDGKGGTKGGNWGSLAAKLLGQRLVMCGSVVHWDAETAHAARVDTELDMLTAILQLVGSIKHVSLVFEKALITPDGRLT